MVKFYSCETCDGIGEYTIRKPRWCKPCYRAKKAEDARQSYLRKKGGKALEYAPRSKDEMPSIDWIMERQFPNFFALCRIRYDSPDKVRQAIGHQGEKWG